MFKDCALTKQKDGLKLKCCFKGLPGLSLNQKQIKCLKEPIYGTHQVHTIILTMPMSTGTP